ncbi:MULTISPECIES: hypothetical protein [Bacillus]|uniref:hypothetical protein n=1 Tax=Bacillus TaxID=1386 RepID=UPI00047C4B50|nr:MULTISPECIES: hypothetical protein [Bacillus]QHZ46911.1 hypothetical protein M654_011655 [Bacillus sp. NSP9.1]WFA07042.1 hypothetical protein P3X63_09830 [Bacillus sp. HSf4]
MSDNPVTIQRNRLDVAMELTQLHIKQFHILEEEEIPGIYAQYYALAHCLQKDSQKLHEFLPQEIRNKLYK